MSVPELEIEIRPYIKEGLSVYEIYKKVFRRSKMSGVRLVEAICTLHFDIKHKWPKNEQVLEGLDKCRDEEVVKKEAIKIFKLVSK